MLIDSAVREVKGKVSEQGCRTCSALRKADFKSNRGDFKFNANHFPIQTYYMREVVKDGSDARDQDDRDGHDRSEGRLFPRLQDAEIASPKGVHSSIAQTFTANTSIMMLLLFEQILNGLQLGIVLFLMAAGLTLTFGIMNLVNLAHGSLFMMGAYLAVTFQLLDRLVRPRQQCLGFSERLSSACIARASDHPASLSSRSSRPGSMHGRHHFLLQ